LDEHLGFAAASRPQKWYLVVSASDACLDDLVADSELVVNEVQTEERLQLSSNGDCLAESLLRANDLLS
jgi:hypothetical protein